ncbi:MAG: FadR/GntR family transcriptional regulator [Acetobacteraceae bacterium]
MNRTGNETARQRGDAERLRRTLEREVRSSRWHDGEKLPTERALGERYGVARNTVRRALHALAAEKLITRHVGRGTFKASDGQAEEADSFAMRPEALGPADVIECRLVFEPELAALVVARAAAVDFDRMEECLAGADAALDVAGFEHWDAALHDAIAAATHNQTIIAVSRALARVRLQAEWGKLKARSMTVEHRAALEAQHHAIVDALRQRDRDAARHLLRTHILYVQSYMFGE